MRYAVLIYGSPDAFDGLSEQEREAVYREYMDLIDRRAGGVRK